MTALRNIVLLAAFLISIIIIAVTLSSEEATDEAKLFLQQLKQGDTAGLLSQFGDNTCNCQPRGGYIAYLRYQSGEQNNLSVLLGQAFNFQDLTVKNVPTKSKYKGGNLPWEQPESTEVDIPIQFESANRPYFLPLDMAFGYEMDEKALNAFCQNPESGFANALALRLRPSLDSGLIPPLSEESDPKKKPEFTADVFRQLLPKAETRYLRPQDAGKVKLTSGQIVSASAFANKLPRLKAITLKLLIGRRGKFKRWAVGKGFLRNPQLELASGQVLKLQNPSWEGDPGGNTIPLSETDSEQKAQ